MLACCFGMRIQAPMLMLAPLLVQTMVVVQEGARGQLPCMAIHATENRPSLPPSLALSNVLYSFCSRFNACLLAIALFNSETLSPR